ncbi:YycH family regulatory protein [Gracilibacillus timonensis]|uniref:YycH family regulatory protein n=1 Tax=Gracilibacillus timonensis TaxID=1816696 RepID=UPI0008266546|nr:two-component system activity regulator YycH [Gracilibacillus timonensis]
MKLNVEFLKTVLLVFLVALSLLLTLGLWTFQGDYETSNSDMAADAQMNGTTDDKQNLVWPNQLLLHDGDAPFALQDKTVERDIFNDIASWTIYDFEIMTEENAFERSNYSQVAEIVFPTDIPFSSIRDIFPAVDDTMRFDGKFKRIYIILDENLSNNQIIFDNENDGGVDITASVQNINQVIEYFMNQREENDLTELIEATINNDRTVYIPKKPEINGRMVRFETINADSTNFLNIFFRKPSTVASSPDIQGGTVYSDGQRELAVRDYAMEYTNFSISDAQDADLEEPMNPSDYLLSSAISHINSHNGWFMGQGTYYRLSGLSDVSQTVEFRLTHDNYPVFSTQGLASINIMYQNQSVYRYSRPLMNLTRSYERSATDLMTGGELKDYLDESERFDWSQILDIQLGYKLEQQPGGQYFALIPTWCVETYSGWEYISSDVAPANQGGKPDAMGTN